MKSTLISLLPADFPWLHHIHVLDQVNSTNDLAKQMAAAGAPHGTVIIARQQTAGRGRMGRSFSSAEGGLYLSLLLRPQCAPQALMHLTCAAAVAGCEAMEAVSGISPQIKWTNDLVYGKRKLGGILTELALNAADGLVDYAIIGIGINCAQSAEDFPPEVRQIAASLSSVCGKTVTPEQMGAALIQVLYKMDSQLADKAAIMALYRDRCMTVGQDISLLRGDAVLHGKALDVDDDGALRVLFDDGSVQSVSSGEVSVRGMYGYV